MIGVLHQYPQMLFTFGLVELQIYDHPEAPDGRLIVPQLLVNTQEVIRGIVRVKTEGPAEVSVELEKESDKKSPAYKRRTLSEDEFFEKIKNQDTQDLFRNLLEFANEIGALITWRSGGVSIRLPDPGGNKQMLTLFVMTDHETIYFGWLVNQLKNLGIDIQIATSYVQKIADLFSNVEVRSNDPSSLSRELKAKEVAEHYDEFTEILRDTVEQIKG